LERIDCRIKSGNDEDQIPSLILRSGASRVSKDEAFRGDLPAGALLWLAATVAGVAMTRYSAPSFRVGSFAH
jgi:hypothetical protein